MNPLILYHANCIDGFCAAYFFAKAFPGAELLAVTHGRGVPEVTGREVYILDFSFKRRVMQELADAATRLVLLDHHKTAAEELEGFTHERASITIDMERSGGRLAWEYLHREEKLPRALQEKYSPQRPPELVAYTEDRDLWRWALPHSRAINANIRSFVMGFTSWDLLATSQMTQPEFIEAGQAILRDEERKVEAHTSYAHEVTLFGHRGLAVNATLLQSEIAHALALHADFGACYVARPDGSWVWSLRSKPGGLDVSALATQLGGGGHKHAAGFSIPSRQQGELLGLFPNPSAA
jgi:uncharacterized protein